MSPFHLIIWLIAVLGSAILGCAFLLRGLRGVRQRYLKVGGKVFPEPYFGFEAVREGAFLMLVGFMFLFASALILWVGVHTHA